ncbi:hypothetical protein HDU93_005108 [Gonapodya sp. JEL0774]|nr:hypothetical protein HDU93_005108 [Gonapodya sp. JEL0774]
MSQERPGETGDVPTTANNNASDGEHSSPQTDADKVNDVTLSRLPAMLKSALDQHRRDARTISELRKSLEATRNQELTQSNVDIDTQLELRKMKAELGRAIKELESKNQEVSSLKKRIVRRKFDENGVGEAIEDKASVPGDVDANNVNKEVAALEQINSDLIVENNRLEEESHRLRGEVLLVQEGALESTLAASKVKELEQQILNLKLFQENGDSEKVVELQGRVADLSRRLTEAEYSANSTQRQNIAERLGATSNYNEIIATAEYDDFVETYADDRLLRISGQVREISHSNDQLLDIWKTLVKGMESLGNIATEQNTRLGKYTNEFNTMYREIDRQSKVVLDLQYQKSEIENEVERLKAILQQEREHSEETIQELNVQVQSKQAAYDKLDRRIHHLEESVSDISAQLRQSRDINSDLEEDNTRLAHKVARLSEEVARLNSEKSDLRTANEKQAAEVATLVEANVLREASEKAASVGELSQLDKFTNRHASSLGSIRL